MARPHESGDGPLSTIGRYYEHAEEGVAQPCGGRYEASPASWHWHPRAFCCHFDGIFLPWMIGAATSLLEDVKNDQNNHGEHDRHHNGAETAQAVGEKDHRQGTFRWDTSAEGVRLPRYVEAGTGSTPRCPPGRQRSSRRRVSQLPRMLPCLVTASAAYCEQLG